MHRENKLKLQIKRLNHANWPLFAIYFFLCCQISLIKASEQTVFISTELVNQDSQKPNQLTNNQQRQRHRHQEPTEYLGKF